MGAGRLAAVERAYAILRDPHLRARYDARSAAHESQPTTRSRRRLRPLQPGLAQQPSASAAAAPAMVRVVAERHPVGSPGGVLDFGRYAGWSLRQLAAHDPDYLEWLVHEPGGRQYRGQIHGAAGPLIEVRARALTLRASAQVLRRGRRSGASFV